jgi:drug/metabolite transporter (DMT)-like permease
MRPSTAAILLLALAAFAANSLLCRLALGSCAIDAASFSTIRLASGALFLLAVSCLTGRAPERRAGNWQSASALSLYALCFSFAYVRLSAGSGALLLFGAVQGTMLLHGLRAGERPTLAQWLGLGVAAAGLVCLVLPGVTAPSPVAAVLMLLAGVAWGFYSIRGRGSADPLGTTTGNFLRAIPLAVAVSMLTLHHLHASTTGVLLATLSGSLASGAGYVLWYSVVPRLTTTIAATVQLAVPVLTACGGVLLLGEQLTPRLLLAGLAIIGGVGMAVVSHRPTRLAARYVREE